MLVFVSDDQTRLTVTPEVMPTVYRALVTHGVSYPRFTVSDPLCCPSRASIMTGRYDHNNGVIDNGVVSVFQLDQRSTIQCYLHKAGYRTGFYGKYLNGYPIDAPHLCLDDFAINHGEQHEGLRVNRNGRIVRPTGYLDEFGLRYANRFIRRRSGGRHPWYVYFADSYPHSPYVPRPKYADLNISAPPGTETPALGETDVTDKPAPVQARYGHQLGQNQTLENELRMLRTVDDHFASLLATLRSAHQLRNTMIIYVSDNGYLFGEHGLWGKAWPYFEAVNVPMMIRFPHGLRAGTADQRQAQNIDLVPTIRRVTNIHTKLRYPFDGRSLLGTWRRPVILTENFWTPTPTHPKEQHSRWRSITTRTYQYTEWRDSGRIIAREYYDRTADPYQLTNLLGDGNPANDPDVAALHAILFRWARCAGITCR